MRTKNTMPIRWHEYQDIFMKTSELLQVAASYKAAAKKMALTYKQMSGEKPLIARSAKDMVQYAAEGLITPLQTGMAVVDTIAFHRAFHYESSDARVGAHISANMVIKAKNKKYIDTAALTIARVADTQKKTIEKDTVFRGKAGKDFILTEAVQFGTPQQHLLFSQPVQMTVAVAQEDGKMLDVFVQHEGQPWNNEGLTTNPYATCREDGTVIDEKMTPVIVQQGKVVFYTCGASTFALGYVP